MSPSIINMFDITYDYFFSRGFVCLLFFFFFNRYSVQNNTFMFISHHYFFKFEMSKEKKCSIYIWKNIH
jgi:hypothetical protein